MLQNAIIVSFWKHDSCILLYAKFKFTNKLESQINE